MGDWSAAVPIETYCGKGVWCARLGRGRGSSLACDGQLHLEFGLAMSVCMAASDSLSLTIVFLKSMLYRFYFYEELLPTTTTESLGSIILSIEQL